MMKYFKIGFVTIATFFSASLAYAHGVEPLHGGTVVDFGGSFHLEGKAEKGVVYLYLLSETGVTSIAKHAGGSITILVPGKGAKTTKIAPENAFSEFSAPIDGIGKISVQVKLTEGTIKHLANFKFDIK